MKFRDAALAWAIVLAPAAGLAQPVTGPYINLGGGIDYLQNQTVHGSAEAYTGNHLGVNIGPIGSASIGYGLGNGLRIELQGDFSSEKFYRGGTNYFQQYHGFANVLYDINGAAVGLPWLSPYVGVGGGYSQSHLVNVNVSGTDPIGNPYYLHSTGTDGNYAIQAIAGLAFNISDIPGLALTAEYRFTASPSDSTYAAQLFDADTDSRVKLHTDSQYNHVAMLGVRYSLFSAPPPPPPVPAQAAPPPPVPPEATRTYLVFFDWDRADLSARARQIVAEAAAASTKVQITRINVNGYTDLSGTQAYNQRLSLRRAQSVEAELVRDGVPQNEISIHGYGESNPLVPTANGVREPQNRRVEIILQ
jgi:outer membrane protein OmpA-like peptidoglycan-associated protein